MKIVKIFLDKGRDVELGARTLKYILVFVFDYLSTLLLLYLALLLLLIHICLILCLHLFQSKRVIEAP